MFSRSVISARVLRRLFFPRHPVKISTSSQLSMSRVLQHVGPLHRCERRCLYVSAFLGRKTMKNMGHCQSMDENIDITVIDNGHMLEVTWNGGFQSRFHSIWLRHNCHCPACKQPTSGQGLIEVSTIEPSKVRVTNVHIEGDFVEIEWDEGTRIHQGRVPIDLLQRDHCYLADTRRQQSNERKMKYLEGREIPRHSYAEIMTSERHMHRWLSSVNDYGIALVTDCPYDENTVVQLAESIAPIQIGIYGKTYNIKSVVNPINIAYSSVPLGFHTDYIYIEAPLGVAFLHCLRFDHEVEGGESIYVDAFAVAEELRAKFPQHFDTLVRVPPTYSKVHVDRDYPVYMKYQYPTITLNHEQEIIGVRWGPYFEGPLQVAEEDVMSYYEAQHTFAKLLEESSTRLKYRLQPGECVTFNNRRLLHGREGFVLNGGMRYFKGCYVSSDEFQSKCQLLEIKHGEGKLAKRFGNCNYL